MSFNAKLKLRWSLRQNKMKTIFQNISIQAALVSAHGILTLVSKRLSGRSPESSERYVNTKREGVSSSSDLSKFKESLVSNFGTLLLFFYYLFAHRISCLMSHHRVSSCACGMFTLFSLRYCPWEFLWRSCLDRQTHYGCTISHTPRNIKFRSNLSCAYFATSIFHARCIVFLISKPITDYDSMSSSEVKKRFT